MSQAVKVGGQHGLNVTMAPRLSFSFWYADPSDYSQMCLAKVPLKLQLQKET